MNSHLPKPRQETWLTLEALGCLVFSQFCLKFLPFSQIQRHFGIAGLELPRRPDTPRVLAIGRAIERASKLLPLPFTCLGQATAAKIMLRRRRLASSLYLGTRVGDSGDFLAHAWLRAEESVLTGAWESRDFTTLVVFSEDSLPC